jgi:hypothetical protein
MCRKGTVVRTKAYRMNKFGVVVGYLLLAGSAIWTLLVLVRLLTLPASPQGPFEQFRVSLASDFLGCFAVVGAVGILFGWLLVSKKNVLMCDQCGVQIPASMESEYGQTAE